MRVAVLHFHIHTGPPVYDGRVEDSEELSIEMRAIRALLKWHDAVIQDFSLPHEELLGRTDISNEQRIIFAERHQTPAKVSALLKVLGQHFKVSGDDYPQIFVFNSDAGKVRDVLFALDLEKELRAGPFYAPELRMGGV